MSEFYKFPSIKAFQHRATQGRRGDHTEMEFGIFPKLHGTNAAIGLFNDGTVTIQSRNRLLDIHNDNAGFANFVNSLVITGMGLRPRGLIFYGEWCGGNVQSGGDAICKVPDKYFVVFSVLSLETNIMINEPPHLRHIVGQVFGQHKNIIVMEPLDYIWFSFSSDEGVQEACDTVNKFVEEHETQCAFTKTYFDIDGPGEGVVVSPINETLQNYEAWTFKAKTDAHAVNKSSKPAVVKVEASEDVKDFVARFATEARFEQAVSELDISRDMRNTGDFLKWVMQDINKESQEELEASGLTWKEVNGPLVKASKDWFVSQVQSQ